MSRRGIGMGLALTALGLLGLCAGGAAAQRGPARDLISFSAHEWGVWLFEHDRVSLDALARESPSFVHREAPAPGPIHALPVPPPPIGHPPGPPRPPPLIQPMPPVARKPVLFFHAAGPIDVQIRVGFRDGQPWLYYPLATRTPVGDQHGLAWSGHVEPNGRAQLAPVTAGHWWEHLRAAGGDLFLPTGSNEAERFVFYDGPARIERPFQVAEQNGGAAVTPDGTETTLWLVQRGNFSELRVTARPMTQTETARGDASAFRTRLETELRRRGLTDREARALLDTWGPELFESPERRAVYFVSRAAYDEALPLTITPAPSELVRVGLIVETL